MKIFLGVFAGLAVVVVLTLMSVVGVYNDAVSREEEIMAIHENNQNILGQFYAELDESVQITEMYADDFREVMTGMIQGRYGDDGMQAQWAWVQEQMPNMDSSMYQRLQQIVTRGRANFRDEQARQRDRIRQYNVIQRQFFSGMLLRMMGFPQVNMDDYQPIIYSETVEVYETGIEQRRTIGSQN